MLQKNKVTEKVSASRKISKTLAAAIGMIGILVGISATAADWSDTSIAWRYGTQFAEPFETNDITKHIVSLTHVSGYKYGTNFFNVDMLYSDKKDPSAIGSSNGAQEIYIVYRNTVDLGKATGTEFKFGPAKAWALLSASTPIPRRIPVTTPRKTCWS